MTACSCLAHCLLCTCLMQQGSARLHEDRAQALHSTEKSFWPALSSRARLADMQQSALACCME